MSSIPESSIPESSILVINDDMPEELYSKCAEVEQQCMAITHSNDEKYCLGTFGLGCCISLMGYCSETKVGLLTHLDLMGLVEDFGKVYYNLDKISKTMNKKIKMVGYIVGGDDITENLFVDKIKYKCKIMNHCWRDTVEINITYYAIYENNPSSVALNTKDGKIYLYDAMLSQFKDKTDIELKMNELRIVCNSCSEDPTITLSYLAK